MGLELEARLDYETIKQSIDETINTAINAAERTDFQNKMLVYIANYVRSKGEIVSMHDLKDLFEDTVCSHAVQPETTLMNSQLKIFYNTGFFTNIALGVAFTLYDPNLWWGALIASGVGFWYLPRAVNKKREKNINEIKKLKFVFEKDYDKLPEQNFEKIFSSVLDKYPMLKEGRYV